MIMRNITVCTEISVIFIEMISVRDSHLREKLISGDNKEIYTAF